MLSVLGFLIILGPLVVFHEFGHYIFARVFNVKAEIFSIGFGPKLWGRKFGETELRFSAFPLGGYVKLLGEDRDANLSAAESKRALQNQKAWKRFFIFFGGPLFNFILAIIVFMLIFVIGEPQLASVAGRVVHGSVAERAGFVSGDRILAVDGQPVKRFEELMVAVDRHPGKPMKLEVEHPGVPKPVELTVTPTPEKGFSMYGEPTEVGDIDGLFPNPLSAQAGVSDPGSAAGRAGIRTGDQILALNGTPASTWQDLEGLYAAAAPGEKINLKVQTGRERAREVTLVKPTSGGGWFGEAWGLQSSELFVDKVVPKSPAQAAGLRPGDRVVKVGGRTISSFFALKDAVQDFGERDGKVRFEWQRGGKDFSAVIVPTSRVVHDPSLKVTRQYTVGIMPMMDVAPAAQVIERIYNPITLLYRGTARMLDFTWRNLVLIRKMFSGDVSINTLGGPIMIGKIAGESLAHGLVAFLTTMALLSVGLGVLNVLPVPVLDGGHLLLLALEIIRGKPLTLRQMEIVQQVGLSLILILMVLVIRNDITRLAFD